MAAAPGWGADCGGLTPSLVSPATSSCGHEIPRTLWWLENKPQQWLGSGSRWEWESRKRDWGERIVPSLPWKEDAVQVLLCFAGTAHIILLHPEQSGLCGHFDLWAAPGSSNKWINHFWRKEMMVPLAELLTSEGERLFDTPCSDTTAGKSLLEQLNEIPSAKKDAHLYWICNKTLIINTGR